MFQQMESPFGTRETKIRRDREGRWWNEDELINPRVALAFDGWLELAEDGRRCLRNDINWAYVAVEGPDLVVTNVTEEGGVLFLVTRGGRVFPLEPSTLRIARDHAFECAVGRMTARFDRHAAHQLGARFEEGPSGPVLRIKGVTYSIPPEAY